MSLLDIKLLEDLCRIPAPSGEENVLSNFLLEYINNNKKNWKVNPRIYSGKGFQDCIVLVFGKPRTVVYAHMDSVGFTVRYGRELVRIGGPKVQDGYKLVGKDSKGEIECVLQIHPDTHKLYYDFHREIDRGTSLTFKSNFRAEGDYILSNYIDNRLGILNALKQAETLKNGVIAFTTWEEHKGGSVEFLTKFLYEKYKISQALISDITWITEGVTHGKGCAISIRDSGIPRRSFVNKIINIAQKHSIPYQLEIEDAGGSDGQSVQRSPYPVDWCFVGAAEDNVHSPDEKVMKKDIESMFLLYQVLLNDL